MPISMYQASIPVCARALENLSNVLAKGAAHAEAKKIEPGVLLNYRLYPDMFTLTRQVQIATDMAKGCAARLSGAEPPKYDDNEASFDDLKKRIDKTVGYLKGFKPAQIDGSEQKTITLSLRSGTLTFNGLDYLQKFVIPNVYFHVTTAYDILRHCGVEIGKQDFIGKT